MSPPRVVTTRRADDDIASAVIYYLESGAVDAASRFVDSLEAARDLLRAHPSMGSPRLAIETGMPEIRGLALQHFPYWVIYSEDPDAIRIHRVLHTSRDIAVELGSAPAPRDSAPPS